MGAHLGYVRARRFPVSAVGAIASLSSERNAVNKSSALTMNRIDAKKQSVLGKMLGDAVGPALGMPHNNSALRI